MDGDTAGTGLGASAFCGGCGARSDGSRFCKHCGSGLRSPSAPAEAPSIVGADRPSTSSDGDLTDQQGQGPASQLPSVAAIYQDVSPTPPGGNSVPPRPPIVERPQGPEGATQLPPPPVYAVAKRRPKRAWVIGGVVAGVLLLAGATIAIVLALTRQQGPSYSQQAGQVLGPLFLDNARLASAVSGLTVGGTTEATHVVITTTQTETQAVQQQLAALKPTQSNAALEAQIDAALTAEDQWLQTAATVLTNPSSPLVSQLSGLGLDAQSKFQGLGTSIPAAAHPTFPSSTQIVTYVSAVNANAQATAANTQFSNQVTALLNQSSPAFQQVNSFFQQLQTAASGAYSTITLAQAEQQISSIVASRTSLTAAAQALNASTPAAQSVQKLLVTAFSDSLKNDNDLANCLNEANNGTDAFIFQSCLSSSSGDSSTATNDKQAFLAAFNQLLASIGQPAVNTQF